jgi:hypothetical protein
MVNEHWYVLKIRPGFAAVASLTLRKLKFEVFVSESSSIHSDCVYCRFDLQQHREPVLTIPGVMGILGTPEPAPADEDFRLLRLTTR